MKYIVMKKTLNKNARTYIFKKLKLKVELKNILIADDQKVTCACALVLAFWRKKTMKRHFYGQKSLFWRVLAALHRSEISLVLTCFLSIK